MASNTGQFGQGRGAEQASGSQSETQRGVSRAASASDEEAISRAKRGDHAAFRVLVERYQQRVYRLALRILRDEEMARDAVQDAFLKVYASLGRFEGRSSFYTWLYRVVLNLCLDLRRRDRSSRHVEWAEEHTPLSEGADPDSEEPMEGAPPSPHHVLERAELRERMAAAIEELPDAARRTLLLREVDGLSYEEIALALEIPKGTVMSRLHYARRRMQKALIAGGLASEKEMAPRGEPRAQGTGKGGDV
jgi:RNA polymerase sigma-70 factor (ECF subfamily)